MFAIESGIVGYQNKDIPSLLSNQICTFEQVGGEGTKLSEFKPLNSDGEPLSGGIVVQFYNEYGKFLHGYTWWLGADIDTGYADGWYNDDMEPVDSDLALGEGFKVYTTETGAKLAYAGQVDTGAIAVPVSALLSSMGNIRPSQIKMNDITPVNEDDEAISGEIVMQNYNEYGKFIEGLTWWLGADIDTGYADGWYNDDMEPRNDDLQAGAGFCIYTTTSGAYLKFKAL